MQVWHLFWKTSANDCFCTALAPLIVTYSFYFWWVATRKNETKLKKNRKNMEKENNSNKSDFSKNEIPDLNYLKPFKFEPNTNIRDIISNSSDERGWRCWMKWILLSWDICLHWHYVNVDFCPHIKICTR